MWSNKKKTPSEQPKPEENFEDPYATSWPSEEEGEGFNTEDPSYEAPIEGNTGQYDQYDPSTAPEPGVELDGKAGLLQKPQQSQATDISASLQGCMAFSFVSGISGAFIGGFMGAAFGQFETWQNKTVSQLRVPHIRMRSAAGAKDLGGFFAVYNGAHCGAKHLRGKDDVLNAGIAGFSVGMFQGLHTRKPPQQTLAAAFTTGILFMCYDAYVRA